MAEYIEREAAVDALNKALFAYEDETEERFKNDPELDIAEWFFHRIFVQHMNGIDRQTILDIPAADVRPVVLCRDCKHSAVDLENMRYCKCMAYYNHVQDDWFCADGKKREES